MTPLLSWHSRITVTLIIALLPTTGCSWLFVQKPPLGPIEPAPPVECTSSKAPPVVDTIGSVSLWVAGILIIATSAAAKSCVSNPTGWENLFCVTPGERALTIGSGLAVIGGGWALGRSGDYGYSNTAKCRELNETQLACVSGVESACRSLKERKP